MDLLDGTAERLHLRVRKSCGLLLGATFVAPLRAELPKIGAEFGLLRACGSGRRRLPASSIMGKDWARRSRTPPPWALAAARCRPGCYRSADRRPSRKLFSGKHGNRAFAVDMPSVAARRRRLRRSGFVGKNQARAELTRVLACERSGVAVDDRQTVAEYSDDWFKTKARGLQPTTVVRYRD